MAIDATKLELGPANIYLGIKPSAFLATSLAGANNDLRLEAQKPGAAGNSITFAIVVSGTNTVLSVTVAGLAITVNSATDGGGLATSTADQVIAAVNASAAASGLVKATRKSPDNGTGVITALGATALAGGSDTATMTDVGALGDEVQITLATEAGPLTAAQLGTIPLDKVIIGGRFQIAIPFKEIKEENFARAFPNAIFYQDGGTLKKVEFRSRVGLSMRSRAVRVEIRKIVGGVESTLAKDIMVIPEASPVDSEAIIPYTPTTQRVITSTWEAWPSASGVWAFMGDDPI